MKNYIDVNALVKKLLDAERANRKLREELSLLKEKFKPSEEESVGGQVEESILRLLAILVHWITNNTKADQRVFQEVIILVVSVREYKELD